MRGSVHETKTEAILSLEYLMELPRTRWAWEFLRRNPEYVDEHEQHQNGHLLRKISPNGTEFLKLKREEPGAEKWGLLFYADPNDNALNAPAFWIERVSPSVVNVEVARSQSDDSLQLISKLFDLNFFGLKRVHLTDANGDEHLLLQRGERVVQLRCSGHTLLDPDVKLRFILDGFGSLDAKVDTIKRLYKLYEEHIKEQKSHRLWDHSGRQIRDSLIALDVYQAGLGYFETAVAIHGESYTEEHFNTDSERLKSRMRRLRQAGLKYMNGGYLNLMK